MTRLPTLTARLEKPTDEQGSASLELAILAPVIIALLLMLVAFGRTASATSHVDGAAYATARAASIERSSTSAQASANTTARDYLDQRGLTCQPQVIDIDTSGFARAVGQRAQVQVTISCTVPMSEITGVLPFGSRTFTATAVSPIDSYRGVQ